ncbi:MAG: ATP-dependent DNA helicase RecG [Patescibacteria group bacterium]
MTRKTISLDSPIIELHSIAAKISRDLKNIGLNTISDLLWYFPWRYDDLSQIKLISELEPDLLCTIQVKIDKLRSYRSWQRKIFITEAQLSDASGQLTALWFNQKFVSQILKSGDTVYLSGKPQLNKKTWQLINPTYEKVKPNPLHSARLVPIYHLTGHITQKQLRFLIDRALNNTVDLNDPLPVDILNKEKYPWLHLALQEIHFPSQKQKLNQAIKRLKFQELFYLQCKYQLAKKDYQNRPAPANKINNQIIAETVKRLPFELTADQNLSLKEILADLNKQQPMNRLLEGDVGSGKTVVALLAAINVMSQNQQAAFMAPTEILAEQHFKTAQKIIPNQYLNQVCLLTKDQQILGADKNSSTTELLKKIRNGQLKLIIGTHSLIQEKVDFKNLSLAIIDEQHRFGVRQRQAIRQKNTSDLSPHLLSMTATPIPRTLSLTLYGDLDISLIKNKPLGRQAIKTFIIPEKKRADAYKFIRERIALGQQVFVICPLIDESDSLGVKSVSQEYNKLQNEIFSDLKVGYLHGQLKSDAKQDIMADFRANKFPILIATSVIEVGVDIPGATIMIIEGAERFGLSQLHQFRGRIGRNDLESFCFLFTTDPSQNNLKRLKALTQTNDGFELAELDLKLRGAGEIFGTKQTGLLQLKIASLSDTELIKKAQVWAKQIISNPKYKHHQDLLKLLQTLKTEMHLE